MCYPLSITPDSREGGMIQVHFAARAAPNCGPRLEGRVTQERWREQTLLFAFLVGPFAPIAVVGLFGLRFLQALALAVGLDAAPFDAPLAGAVLVFFALLCLADVVQIDNISHIKGFQLAKMSPGSGDVKLAGYFVPQR
jgi:hypothetical protein